MFQQRDPRRDRRQNGRQNRRPKRLVALAVVMATGCGGTATALEREQWRAKLRDAVQGQVSSRQQNQQNSRLVEQALDEGALEDMMRFEVRAAIGKGESCQNHPKCSELGFQADDWYYTVGEGDEQQIGKRPAFIVGFGPKARVIRTWNLRIH